MLDVSPVRAFSDNYLWLIRAPRDGRRAVVVDPGDARPIEAALEQQGLALGAILVTHHHPDHVGGVQALAARHGVEVYGPARETMPCEVRPLDDGDIASLADLGLEFRVMAVPGHTLGHVAYYMPSEEAVFAGDTLFSLGCGRVFEGTMEQMHRSVAQFAALPPATRLYCGHEYTQSNARFALAMEPGNAALVARAAEVDRLRATNQMTCPSTIGAELAANPFLRTQSEEIRHTLGMANASDVEVFAELRERKNSFK